jgi:hypothetical protein
MGIGGPARWATRAMAWVALRSSMGLPVQLMPPVGMAGSSRPERKRTLDEEAHVPACRARGADRRVLGGRGAGQPPMTLANGLTAPKRPQTKSERIDDMYRFGVKARLVGGRRSVRLIIALLGVLVTMASVTPANSLAYQINGPANGVILGAETVCTNNLTSNPWSWSVTEASGPMIKFPTGSTPPYQTARRWWYLQQSVDGGRTWSFLAQGQSALSTLAYTGMFSGTPIFQFQPMSQSVYFYQANSTIKVRAWDSFAVYDKYGVQKWYTPNWIPNDTYRTDLFYQTTDLWDYNHGIIHYANTCMLGNS